MANDDLPPAVDYKDIQRLEEAIAALQKITSIKFSLVNEKFIARDLALKRTLKGIDGKFVAGNEFRGALSDQNRDMIRRPEHDTLSSRVGRSEERMSKVEGSALAFGFIVPMVVSAIVAIAVTFLHLAK